MKAGPALGVPSRSKSLLPFPVTLQRLGYGFPGRVHRGPGLEIKALWNQKAEQAWEVMAAGRKRGGLRGCSEHGFSAPVLLAFWAEGSWLLGAAIGAAGC